MMYKHKIHVQGIVNERDFTSTIVQQYSVVDEPDYKSTQDGIFTFLDYFLTIFYTLTCILPYAIHCMHFQNSEIRIRGQSKAFKLENQMKKYWTVFMSNIPLPRQDSKLRL